mmetsp:Transcript_7508/g.11763  ORF Transcript_7508/g.11763 Transcript_7508/m.11763 type:complete len:681 (-) Transcript_7508:150-2192(-)|eukprot:CAMPEP_0194212260 /NCGR_PEP_ID=MMETSP0156-20130528/11947_1 /TAXON_ID=33649 /ORGANISM="Thalassionema nitzschioides, Strain L26-B" /LENGTH=680 /DNA_ID=CAMNT_0038940037 /DNA_START=52 /DNA_END=2094 /DNA_ORIENTATION=-
MKFSIAAISALMLADTSSAFVAPRQHAIGSSGNALRMAVDMPPALESAVVNVQQSSDMPVIKQNSMGQPSSVRYSDFLKLVNADKIEKVTFSADGSQLLGVDVDGDRIKIETLPNDPDLLNQLTKHKVDVTVLPQQEASGLGDLAQSLIFPAVLFAGLFFLSRNAGGGMGGPMGGGMGGNPMGFGKSKAELQMVPDTGVSFDDVAGCDGAKLELSEVVDFLKQPEAYTKNGCRIPRGVILDGPPGTGKTLLAKAVAGEAGVPFISISGSEFVEMFVGVGASRVRDIFAQARKNAPCIIFIDEIDAVGRQRGAGYAGGNDEREQTVNQILVEMDGFDGNPGIITIAATNRIDILDNALLRPGRFDRKVTVDLPDFKGRTRILGVHSRGKPLEPDVDLEAIARRTPGYSGAQLENLMNEAAITAARAGKATIGWEQIDGAVDRLMVGLEKEGGNQLPRLKELVAYHEAGHAIVGALVPDYDQVQKISIIPRSNGAGGLTFFAPQESRLESGMYSKQYLESQLAVALGGRLAEELIYGEDMVTTGASNDIQQVANIAKRMVKEWGMSDKVGRVAVSEPQGPSFMGMGMLRRSTTWGEEINKEIGGEVERLVNNSYLLAKKILQDNSAMLEELKEMLMDTEVVSSEEFQMLLVKYGAKTVGYEVLGDEKNRDKLPFQQLPGFAS